MKKIFLDTNFLIDAVRFKFDLDDIGGLVGQHKIIILSSVVDELKEISRTKKTVAKYASTALKLAEKFPVQPSGKINADSDLIAKVDEDNIVATNDSELRKILNGKGVKTIYLRARKHLAIG